jgi:hypothetical protein
MLTRAHPQEPHMKLLLEHRDIKIMVDHDDDLIAVWFGRRLVSARKLPGARGGYSVITNHRPIRRLSTQRRTAQALIEAAQEIRPTWRGHGKQPRINPPNRTR